MTDAWRLALGTLTSVPVRPPRHVNRQVAGQAIALAPAVGLLLGLITAGVAAFADQAGLAPLGCAVVVVGCLAVLTRGLHLDGLADTADGLGSGRSGKDGLAVMSRSDVGPFGVVTLVLVLLLQVAALGQLWVDDQATWATVMAVVVSRAALPLACRRGSAPAKRSGLGSAVVGTVPVVPLVASLGASTALVVAIGAAGAGWHGAIAGVAAVVLGLFASTALVRHAERRFGGITGDVLGAAVEVALTVALVTLAMLAG